MTIGDIKEFKVNVNNWSTYITRVNQYFKVNNVADDIKTAILITAMGDEAFELLTDLCAPEKPETKKFDEVVQILTDHLEPKPSEIAERYKFRQRKQENWPNIAILETAWSQI